MTGQTSRTALITEASGGLRIALAKALAQTNWSLTITARGAKALLVALAGPDHVCRTYSQALETGYLWHEFGDLHLILPGEIDYVTVSLHPPIFEGNL